MPTLRATPSHTPSSGLFPGWLFQLCLFVVLLVGAQVAVAVEYSIPGTEVRVLPQSANGRDYTLYVSLPSSYASNPTRKYPVIYACDGYWDFPLLTAEVGNLSYDNAIPECIIVGMAYSGVNPNVGALRQYDLTPWTMGADAGHASEFLSVIENQFIPFIESQYRADPTYRVLTGSSYGGIFTVFAMFERPGLFQGYVAPSPSLWWYGNYIRFTAKNYADTKASLPTRLYLSWGADESSSIRDTTINLYAQLKTLNINGLTFTARECAGERHAGPKGESFNRGLRYVFAPLAPIAPSNYDPGFALKSPMVNLSTRGRVGTGEDILVAGLVIRGYEPKKLLLRGVGPSLKPHGIVDALYDPTITVYDDSQNVVASNNDWWLTTDYSAVVAATTKVGAFDLTEGSRDAAMLITLPPGLYTVQVKSGNGQTGVALIEAYEVP